MSYLVFIPTAMASVMRCALAVVAGLALLWLRSWPAIAPGLQVRKLQKSLPKAAESPGQYPVPNMFEGLSCSGHWETLVPTRWVVSFGLAVGAYAGMALSLHFAFYLCCTPQDLAGRWAPWLLTWVVPAFVALPAAVMGSGAATALLGRIVPHLRGMLHVSLPRHWQRLMQCHVQWVAMPGAILPDACGAHLTESEQRTRLQYYLSVIFFGILASFLTAMLLTALGRGIRWIQDGVRHRGVQRDAAPAPAYAKLQSVRTSHATKEGETETEEGTEPQTRLQVVGFHVLCAALAVWAGATGHVQIRSGLCWEIWTGWMFFMLNISMLQSLYFAVALPTEARVPWFGPEVVMPVLPVLGEQLDSFKDWIFVGLALSQRSLGVHVGRSWFLWGCHVVPRRCWATHLE